MGSLIVTKVKKGIEKKDDINYNIGHTHPGHDIGYRQRLLYFEHAQINDRKKQIIYVPEIRSFHK